MRHLSVLGLLLLLLPACPGDDKPGSGGQGVVSGTLTPYRGASQASSSAPASAPLVALAREALRVRQDVPALPLSAVGPHALPLLDRPMPLARTPRGAGTVPGELLV